MSFCIISSSLNPKSRSALLARAAYEDLKALDPTTDFIDLRDHPLPICDGKQSYGDKHVQALATRLQSAQGILVASAIYNYDVNAALKNLLENTGRQVWENKVVGFLNAAGGQGSYMSVMPFANSLMLDFRCFILPRFVYSTYADFEGDALEGNSELRQRIKDLVHELHRVTLALTR